MEGESDFEEDLAAVTGKELNKNKAKQKSGKFNDDGSDTGDEESNDDISGDLDKKSDDMSEDDVDKDKEDSDDSGSEFDEDGSENNPEDVIYSDVEEGKFTVGVLFK